MMDLDTELQEAAKGEEAALQKQSFEEASKRAKGIFTYAWRHAMAANGQPLALR